MNLFIVFYFRIKTKQDLFQSKKIQQSDDLTKQNVFRDLNKSPEIMI